MNATNSIAQVQQNLTHRWPVHFLIAMEPEITVFTKSATGPNWTSLKRNSSPYIIVLFLPTYGLLGWMRYEWVYINLPPPPPPILSEEHKLSYMQTIWHFHHAGRFQVSYDMAPGSLVSLYRYRCSEELATFIFRSPRGLTCLTPQMKASNLSETTAPKYQFTRRRIPEGQYHKQPFENLKSRVFKIHLIPSYNLRTSLPINILYAFLVSPTQYTTH